MSLPPCVGKFQGSESCELGGTRAKGQKERELADKDWSAVCFFANLLAAFEQLALL